ncbi:hypothetical protein [Lacticaseibacillus daqingensis]|uniref:hypothetical protein n=1 Tax=Lacticaseibacillus daqingensis TaxID=2486014 RepID=UPI000F784858|nr:hypothetical protein [Lacticaseibacillus daqingensis]
MPETLQPLLTAVQAHYSMPIEVVIDGPASGVLTHEQSHQELLANGHLQLTVSDTTDVAYTLSHELLHMQLTTAGYPPLQFHLATGEPQVDQQFFAVATALYDAALHGQIRAWQVAHGLFTPAVEKALAAGFTQKLKGDDATQLSVFRTLTALDAYVMFDGRAGDWLADVPDEATAAADLYGVLAAKPIDSPFAFRRTVIKLWRAFDQTLTRHGYQETGNAEFATLPPVLSERQLRLALNQTFEVRHSALRDRTTRQRAYVAQGKGDGQNAFVLPLPASFSPEAFQKLYQTPLSDILARYELDYTVR